MNLFQTFKLFGLFPPEAGGAWPSRWLMPMEYVSPALVDDDGLQFSHPESGMAHDVELASLLTVVTSTMGSWGH